VKPNTRRLHGMSSEIAIGRHKKGMEKIPCPFPECELQTQTDLLVDKTGWSLELTIVVDDIAIEVTFCGPPGFSILAEA